MADSDFNIITPVESLQNIHGLTPAKRRQERRRQHHGTTEDHNEEEQAEPRATSDQDVSNDGRSHSIDYRA